MCESVFLVVYESMGFGTCTVDFRLFSGGAVTVVLAVDVGLMYVDVFFSSFFWSSFMSSLFNQIFFLRIAINVFCECSVI